MKKILSIALSVILLFGAWNLFPAGAAERDPSGNVGMTVDDSDNVIFGVIGDADRDEIVTILDATRIQRCLAGLYDDSDGMVKIFGDVDEDGLSILDATAIQRFLAGMTVDSPVGQYVIVNITGPSPTEPATEPQNDPGYYEPNDYELQVIVLINEIRVRNGLRELSVDTELCRIARMKAQDMHDNGYFGHDSPVYGSPFDMMRSFGIRFGYAGENIAVGYHTPQAVVDGWMGSEGHRENILSENFSKIGMGYVSGGNYWSQMFIG